MTSKLSVAHLVSSRPQHELVDPIGTTSCGACRQRRETHEAWDVVGTATDFMPDVAKLRDRIRPVVAGGPLPVALAVPTSALQGDLAQLRAESC